jgi:hypothetical protein
LIHSGRLLTDGVVFEAWLRALEERQTRAYEEIQDNMKGDAKMKGKGKAMDMSRSNMWLHCSVGPKMDEGEEEAEQVRFYILYTRTLIVERIFPSRPHKFSPFADSTDYQQLDSRIPTLPISGDSFIVIRTR